MYKSIEPCPDDKTNLSRSKKSGFLGLNFKKSSKRVKATVAAPSGRPGCPELASLIAVAEITLTALTAKIITTISAFSQEKTKNLIT